MTVTEEDAAAQGWLDACKEARGKAGAQRYWDKSAWVSEMRECGKRSNVGLNMMNVKAVMMYFSLSHGNTPYSPKETLVIILN